MLSYCVNSQRTQRVLLAWVVMTLVGAGFQTVSADTVFFKTGDQVKGLVVEEYEDRILLSTSEGERIFFRKDIQNIEYHDLEYNLLSLGNEMEKQKKWYEALSYYEKAVEVNPDLRQAKQAALGIKSRLWAELLDEGPRGEMAKRQEMQDAWRASTELDELGGKEKVTSDRLLWERMGLAISRRREWVSVEKLRLGGMADKKGIRKGDELASLDGKSLRFLNEEAVKRRLLEPRYSNAILELRRDQDLLKTAKEKRLKDFGFTIQQKYNGLTITEVREMGPASLAGLKSDDIVVEINGESTRYMPIKRAVVLIENVPHNKITLKINRSITITRK